MQASALFRATFMVRPQAAASAPGRVNLIGEHTDYHGGPVLPVAIRERTTAAVAPSGPEMLEVVSTLDGKVERFNWRSDVPTGWAAYAAGVVRELAALDALPPDGGVRVAVTSDVPVHAYQYLSYAQERGDADKAVDGLGWLAVGHRSLLQKREAIAYGRSLRPARVRAS